MQPVNIVVDDNGFFDAVFMESGFQVQPFSQVIAVGQTFNSKLMEVKYPYAGNWSLCYGDTDHV